MELHVFQRSGTLKSEIKTIRRRGDIPAVIYSKGEEGQIFFINGREFSAFMRHLEQGQLPTQIFTLIGEDGSKRKAIIKDIQYQATTYNVMHLDFEELHDEIKVKVKVPIKFENVADCVGIKLGGVLRQVIRHTKVECLPRDIPTSFNLDVQHLSMQQSLRLSDIAMPETVRPLARLSEVAVVITKR